MQKFGIFDKSRLKGGGAVSLKRIAEMTGAVLSTAGTLVRRESVKPVNEPEYIIGFDNNGKARELSHSLALICLRFGCHLYGGGSMCDNVTKKFFFDKRYIGRRQNLRGGIVYNGDLGQRLFKLLGDLIQTIDYGAVVECFTALSTFFTGNVFDYNNALTDLYNVGRS